MKDKNTKWVVAFIGTFVLILALMGGFNAIVDPYFHYHAPLDFVKYELKEERYQNNGIVKHFEYDAIITGSSMTQCFKPSELDALFGVNAVKVPFSGGSYKEVNDNLEVAFAYNPDIKMVVRCLDVNALFDDKDLMNYDNCPTYLYDDSVWNDAGYLFNKDILVLSVRSLHGYMVDGSGYLSMDDYVNWHGYYTYGEEVVEASYNREEVEVAEEQVAITEEEYAIMEATIEQNITSLAAANPDTEFYIYFSPYSIYYFDFWYRTGELEKYLLAEKFYIEKLLEYDNIHVYSFFEDYESICNPDYYRDLAHHNGDLHTKILQWMSEGKYEITKENYEEHYQAIHDFYMNYDYDALFAE